ncbi:MAG: PDZ domain-containing protein, partial [Eubacterium sp.]|nr:PDZ domain-containing protein [Eubacterium sp.]
MKRKIVCNKKTAKRLACGTFASLMVVGGVSGCGVVDRLSSVGEKPEIVDETDNADNSSNGSFEEDSQDVKKKTDEIEGIIDQYFYFDQDEEKREESYFDGIMKGLDDPYSVYYTKEEYDKLMEEDSGKFEGIGATVSKDKDKGTVYIVKPIVGSPAEKAGLLPNDIVVAVDDLDITTDMELDFVVDHIRGEKGTTVTLKVYREGEPDYLYIDIVRDTITNTTVSYEMLDNKVGYIQIEQFVENTPDLYVQAIEDLTAQGAKGLVIDLRNNPGGLLK